MWFTCCPEGVNKSVFKALKWEHGTNDILKIILSKPINYVALPSLFHRFDVALKGQWRNRRDVTGRRSILPRLELQKWRRSIYLLEMLMTEE